MVYALSTCPQCRKTKQLLNDLGLEYHFEDVDLIGADDQRNTMAEVSRWNSIRSFPTIVINNKRAIIGYNETEIRNLATP
ncbi:MAG: glutaredoxin family protein [Dehalococcoidia bacterium]|nr:glutaredoxin family protein [Dehalococcoidia bacterium]